MTFGKTVKQGSFNIFKRQLINKQEVFWLPKMVGTNRSEVSSRIKTTCFDSFFCPCSCLQRELITLTNTKRQFPKYPNKKKLTYQTDPLEVEVNKKICTKADSLLARFLSCPRFRLPDSVKTLDEIETSI